MRRSAGRLRHSRRRGEKGQALAELAILLPFFLVIIVGVAEVGDAMNGYITVIDSARDAARLGSKGLATDPQMKNLVITEGARLRNPIFAAGVTVTHPTVNGVAAVRVKVCDNRTLLMHIPLLMPNSFPMCSTTTMRVLPPPP